MKKRSRAFRAKEALNVQHSLPLSTHNRSSRKVRWPNQGVVTWSIFLLREQQRMRPSTYRGYKVLWREIKPFFDGLWTRDARTRHGTADLRSHGENKSLQCFNVDSLRHIESFFSGIFRLADQQGYYEGANPVREPSLPQARPADKVLPGWLACFPPRPRDQP